MSIIIWIIVLVVGFVMLVKGADWFVDGVAGIADRFGVPQLVIGLTIVAMGTSAPEAAVSITAAVSGRESITIGNILGSNMLNILLILGLTSVIIAVPVAKSTIRYEIPFVIAISLLILLLGCTGWRISRWEGVVLWAVFILYLIYLFVMAKKNKEEPEEIKKRPLWKLILLAVVGIALVVVGSDFTVDAASELARYAGLSERFIALTIVAFGTSLPELFTSVTAAAKGKTDIAIGNIVGSNVFNVLFVVGTTALITPVAFSQNFVFDAIAATFAAFLLWLCVFRTKKLKRWGGVIMLAVYAAYFAYLVGTGKA